MKFAVCIPDGSVDGYGHLAHYAGEIARICKERCIDVEVLRFADASFLPRLLANLADPSCIVHFHCYMYDLGVVGNYMSHDIRLTKSCAATTLATISDHPFQNFMQNMVRKADAATRFILIDDTFSDEMRFINPTLCDAKFAYLPYAAPINFDANLKVPFAERDIDLVLPMQLHEQEELNPTRKLEVLPDTWLKRVALATYETGLCDTSRSTFHIFTEHFGNESNGATLEDFRETHPKLMPPLLNIMDAVDGLVRFTRRYNMVRSLLRSIGKYKVVVMGPPISSLGADDNVEFVGTLQTPEATTLMARSKAVLNCNPTYPKNVPERVAVGMLYGSCVITDVNPCIADTFMSNEFIPYSPQSTETISDLFNQYDFAAIGRAAADKVTRHGAFSWDAHFDDLLKVAAE